MSDPVISAAEALALHGQPGLVFLDATWTFPGGPQPQVEGYIPGARRADIDTLSDPQSALPHMLPRPEDFQRQARALGIDRDSHIVVYDRIGLFSAPRVWWMFRAMGHEDVRVMAGGLPAWMRLDGPVEEAPANDWPDGNFTAQPQNDRVADLDRVRVALKRRSHDVVDVRPATRFAGRAPEPREGMRAGHMPGALNLPFTSLVDGEGRLRDSEDILRGAGLTGERPVIATCGSGVTACLLALALDRQGRAAAVYDGSWAEWGSRSDTPIQTD